MTLTFLLDWRCSFPLRILLRGMKTWKSGWFLKPTMLSCLSNMGSSHIPPSVFTVPSVVICSLSSDMTSAISGILSQSSVISIVSSGLWGSWTWAWLSSCNFSFSSCNLHASSSILCFSRMSNIFFDTGRYVVVIDIFIMINLLPLTLVFAGFISWSLACKHFILWLLLFAQSPQIPLWEILDAPQQFQLYLHCCFLDNSNCMDCSVLHLPPTASDL